MESIYSDQESEDYKTHSIRLHPGRRFIRFNWLEVQMAWIIVTDRNGKKHRIEGELGRPTMEFLRAGDFGVAAICGGMCACGTCHVYIDPAWLAKLPEPAASETSLLQELCDYRADRSRLSCQVVFSQDLDGMQLQIAADE